MNELDIDILIKAFNLDPYNNLNTEDKKLIKEIKDNKEAQLVKSFKNKLQSNQSIRQPFSFILFY